MKQRLGVMRVGCWKRYVCRKEIKIWGDTGVRKRGYEPEYSPREVGYGSLSLLGGANCKVPIFSSSSRGLGSSFSCRLVPSSSYRFVPLSSRRIVPDKRLESRNRTLFVKLHKIPSLLP